MAILGTVWTVHVQKKGLSTLAHHLEAADEAGEAKTSLLMDVPCLPDLAPADSSPVRYVDSGDESEYDEGEDEEEEDAEKGSDCDDREENSDEPNGGKYQEPGTYKVQCYFGLRFLF